MPDDPRPRNRALCTACNTVIESKTVHDFVWCPCHTIFIDGGQRYWRGGGDLACFRRVRDDGTIEEPGEG